MSKSANHNIFQCPECNYDIAVGVEEISFHFRVVDSESGNLKGRIIRLSDGAENNIVAFQCVSCAWSVRDGDGQFAYFYKRINKQQFEALEDSVAKLPFKNKSLMRFKVS